MTDIAPIPSGGNPFDDIARTDADGSHYWLARELMPLLGYDKWDRFADTIERAKASASNSGTSDVDTQFMQVAELVGAGNLGTQERVNYRLTRYACYLVAMNGDPRKPEIAAAQTYFAVRTREAETTRSSPRSQIDVLRTALDEIERVQQAAEQAQATAEETSARLDAIEGRHDWFAALGYAKLTGLPTNTVALARLGRMASAVGHRHGVAPNKVQHSLYGEVNQWPRWIWDSAADQLGWGGVA